MQQNIRVKTVIKRSKFNPTDPTAKGHNTLLVPPFRFRDYDVLRIEYPDYRVAYEASIADTYFGYIEHNPKEGSLTYEYPNGAVYAYKDKFKEIRL